MGMRKARYFDPPILERRLCFIELTPLLLVVYIILNKLIHSCSLSPTLSVTSTSLPEGRPAPKKRVTSAPRMDSSMDLA